MTESLYPVTQADIDAWEILGPAIFHGDMTGPEALAKHRLTSQTETPSRDALTDPMTEAAGGQVAAGEPVAWRTEYRDVYKGHDTGWHFRYHTDEPTPGPLVNGCGHKNVVPLYATRPSPSRDALVEALQWYGDQMCEGMCEGCDADAVFSSDRCAGCPARQALAATIPADDGKGEDKRQRRCEHGILWPWQCHDCDYPPLRPAGDEKP